MSTGSLEKRRWIYIVILLLIFIVMGYFAFSSKVEEYPDYLPESPAPTGLKALYTYLENEGISVERWSHSPELLTKENKDQLYMVVEPLFIPEREILDAYEDFMEAGNTILLIKRNPVGVLGIETDFIADLMDDPHPIYDEDENEYDGTVLSHVRIQANEGDEILLTDEEGVIALKRDYGEGQLVVVNTPEWFVNEQIIAHDHTALLSYLFEASAADGTAFLFDEYSHLSAIKSSLLTVYPKWLLIFVFQAGLLTLLLLWYRGKRFGAIVTPREEMVRYSNERINALAAWYQRGREYQTSLKIQADYVKLLLQEKHGIPYYVDWLNIETQLMRVWKNQSITDIRKFLQGIHQMTQKHDIKKAEYLQWSRKLDQLREEVEKDEK